MDSGVTDFFRQIPQGFILMFCGSGILLVLVVVYSIYSRRKQVTDAPYPVSAAPPVYASYDDSAADLPDLDDLASAELKAHTAPAKPRSAGAHVVTLAEGENVEVVEVLSVLRDVGEGGLIIQIGGKAYRNPPAYADADFKRRLHNTLRDLNGAPAADAAPAAPEAPAEAHEEATPAMPAPAAPPPAPRVPLPATRLDPGVPAPGDLPKFRMPDGPVVKPKRGEKLVKEPIPEINIAGSIEAFLQHKLARTPQYAARSIHVVPAAHGGVQIEVDGIFYESVAEVADADVRQFLAATIEEWQARQ